ncbi:MAG: YqgE/AlgH family protein, partial [Oceanospirillaceae bacterium]|nr:YqgE/AlgH family protein [Oceanospirillaceae bacterium]
MADTTDSDNKPNDNNSLHHFMLISMPQMEDENFTRSLVYICEHSEKGAMGLVINRANDIDFT